MTGASKGSHDCDTVNGPALRQIGEEIVEILASG